MTSILFQPTNGVGLGHVSRLAAIALAVRRRRADVRMAFAIQGGSHSLLESLGIPYISVPAELAEDAAVWHGWSETERHRLRLGLAAAVFSALNPSLVVFDVLPSRLFATCALARGCPFILCVREVKNPVQYCRDMKRMLEGASAVLIPHAREEVALPDEILKKAHFVGQIARPLRRGQLAKEPIEPSPLVVVTGGGGGFPGTGNFYNLASQAFDQCRRRRRDLQGRLITGPLFRDWNQLQPVAGMRIVPFEPDMTGLFSAASLVIAQGGYNTMAELASLRVPTICIPAERVFDDQRRRAMALSSQLPSIRLFEGNDAVALSELMDARLATPAERPAAPADPPGADRAAHLVLQLAEAAVTRLSPALPVEAAR